MRREEVEVLAQQPRILEDHDPVRGGALGVGFEVAVKFEPVDDETGFGPPIDRLDQLHRLCLS